MFERILIVFLATVVVLAGYGLWVVLDVPVARLVVESELTPQERMEVEAHLSSEVLDGILSTSLVDIEKRLRALSWARDVQVRRVWPDSLIVNLERRSPVAVWGDGRYVSAAGDLLELADEHAGVPRFDVAVSSPQQAMEVYRLLDQSAGRMNLSIEQIQQNAQGGWQLTFTSGLSVALGAEFLSERMKRFLQVYERVLTTSDRAVAYVDARYPSGVAVRYADQPQLANLPMVGAVRSRVQAGQ